MLIYLKFLGIPINKKNFQKLWLFPAFLHLSIKTIEDIKYFTETDKRVCSKAKTK